MAVSTRSLWAVAALAVVVANVAVPPYTNTKVQRRIDATRHFIRISTVYSANATSASSEVYHVALPNKEAQHVAFIEASMEEWDRDDSTAGSPIEIVVDREAAHPYVLIPPY